MIGNHSFTEDFYKALSFAVKAHDGQRDKIGEPYILHPIAVSSMLKNEDEKILALLHDVVEDTEYTLEDIAALGFGHLTAALDCLSRREDETYEGFILRVLKNRLAVIVKVADMKHNISRIDSLPVNERGFTKRYEEWLPVLIAEMKRERIVAAHAGTGKTTLAKLYPDRFVDFVSMPFKYDLPEEFDENENESSKADPNHELNISWPYNYFDAIKTEINSSDKILLVPPDQRLMWMFRSEDIPFVLCYPENTTAAKAAYRERYTKRGNTDRFLEIFIDGWDGFMKTLTAETFPRHIILKPHQYLTDIVEEIDTGVQ